MQNTRIRRGSAFQERDSDRYNDLSRRGDRFRNYDDYSDRRAAGRDVREDYNRNDFQDDHNFNFDGERFRESRNRNDANDYWQRVSERNARQYSHPQHGNRQQYGGGAYRQRPMNDYNEYNGGRHRDDEYNMGRRSGSSYQQGRGANRDHGYGNQDTGRQDDSRYRQQQTRYGYAEDRYNRNRGENRGWTPEQDPVRYTQYNEPSGDWDDSDRRNRGWDFGRNYERRRRSFTNMTGNNAQGTPGTFGGRRR